MINYIRNFYAWIRRPNKSTFEEYVEAFVVILPIAFIIRTYGYGLYQVPTCSMEHTMLVGERFFSDKFTVLFKDIKRKDVIAFNDPNFKYSKNKFINLWQSYIWGPSNWTKRVIGIPGDHVEGKIENGRPVIYLNGKKLEEPYLNEFPIIAVLKENSGIRERFNQENWTLKTFDPDLPWEKQPFYRINERRIVKIFGKPVIREPGTPIEGGRDVFDVRLGPNQYWVMGDNRLGSSDSREWGVLDRKFIHGKIVLRLWSIDSEESWWIVDLIKHPIDFWRRVRWSRFFQIIR